jgi:hypothetical protein
MGKNHINGINEDELNVEKLLEAYYLQYSGEYKLCECESCSQLLLPFLVLRNVSKMEESEEIYPLHADYLAKCQNEGKIDLEIQKGVETKKINNCYFKTVWLGELAFKWNYEE